MKYNIGDVVVFSDCSVKDKPYAFKQFNPNLHMGEIVAFDEVKNYSIKCSSKRTFLNVKEDNILGMWFINDEELKNAKITVNIVKPNND